MEYMNAMALSDEERKQRRYEKARKQAEKDLTRSWMDRLQLISVIATFFASTEAGMLQLTTNNSGKIANASMLGALVLHIWAAMMSFLGAFVLVRYSLLEARYADDEYEADIQEIGPFHSKPPTHLLKGCHHLCILLTGAGFVGALLGIISFAWGQSVAPGVTASACAGASVFGAAIVFGSRPK